MINAKSKFLTLVFVLMPVMHQYLLAESGSLTLSLLVTSIAIVNIVIRYNNLVIRMDYLERSFLSFFFSLIFLSLLAFMGSDVINFTGYISRIVYCLIYLYFLWIFRRHLDFDYAVNCLIIISVISSIICIIQLFFNPAFGLYLPLKRVKSEAYIIIGNKLLYRPNGLFGEPSHCAYYLATTVLVYLFINKNKSVIRTISIIFITCTACIITSASAIYLLIGIALLYVFIKKKSAKMVVKILIVLCTVFIVIKLLGLQDFLSYGFERFNISSSRLYNGIDFFAKYNWFQKLFGCGIGSYSLLGPVESTFLSGIFRIIIENGIIGAFILVIFIVKVLLKTKGDFRAFILFFILLNLFESAFYSIFLPFILSYIPVEESALDVKVEKIKQCGYNLYIK